MAKKIKDVKFTFRELRMRHFRAFENARLPLDGMTVLLGRNGAGKTSIMLGLEFLREAVVDSLSNVIASAVPLWKQVLRTVRKIRLYSLSPSTIGAEPEIGSTTWLRRDGGNASDVLKSLESRKAVKSWIVRHLAALTPGITDIWTEDTATGRRLIYFQQRTNGRRKHSFASAHMSDGTLRGLGVLLALRQRPAASLVFIDEIEDSVHPAALAVLLDAIADAMSRRIQVVITSHSPEVLSHPAVSASSVRVLEWRDGVSAIYRVADSIQKDLQPPETVGSLLRTNALWPAENPCTVGDDFFEA